jgi:predicted RNase H-like HicB family nuclease
MATQEELEALVNLPYAIEIIPDETTDGRPCYMAMHPELPGCMSHGDTELEARQNLVEARRLYIQSLVEKGLDVPRPRAVITVGTGIVPVVTWEVAVSTQPKASDEEVFSLAKS